MAVELKKIKLFSAVINHLTHDLSMQIERTDEEILIRLSPETDLVGLQRILDYLKFREVASKSKATQKQIDALSSESKSFWWLKNKSRFAR